MEHKIGDKVKLLSRDIFEGVVSGKIYRIIDMNSAMVLLSVKEGIKHYKYDGTNAGWWYNNSDVKRVLELEDGQMLFSFMYEDVE